MSIIISYEKYQNNWYVGELYHAFAIYLNSIYSDIHIVSISDMAKQYNEPAYTRNNNLPSIFNIYNLIVYNTENKTGFLHSLSDHAPVMLDHQLAIEKLNIKAFAFCSNYTLDLIEKYKFLNINLIPSFYILENWNDHDYISKYINSNKINQCYFNGLCYGHRETYVNTLKNHSFFVMKNKRDISDYKPKEQYYKELCQYKYGLSINGAAQICYRDLEYFGSNTLCIREPMNMITKDNLKPDIHYKCVIDNYVMSNIYDPNKKQDIINYIIDKINSISIEEEQYILHNAKSWYNNNALPSKQIEFLHECLVQNGIL